MFDSEGIRRVDIVVSGDSFQAQHSSIKHFGLGEAEGVEHVEVTWPNGKTVRLDRPGINRYHQVK